VGDVRGAQDVDAHGRLRARGATGRRGDDHARPLPLRRVTLFHAQGCSLCDRARERVSRLQDELGFDYEEVDITGDELLEARHRAWLPVVEVDGERAFVYYVDEAAFRKKVSP
jgi:glutaredoxin